MDFYTKIMFSFEIVKSAGRFKRRLGGSQWAAVRALRRCRRSLGRSAVRSRVYPLDLLLVYRPINVGADGGTGRKVTSPPLIFDVAITRFGNGSTSSVNRVKLLFVLYGKVRAERLATLALFTLPGKLIRRFCWFRAVSDPGHSHNKWPPIVNRHTFTELQPL